MLGTGKPRLDFKLLEKHRRNVLEARGDMALKTDKGMKIQFRQGAARFDGPNSIVIDTSGPPGARPLTCAFPCPCTRPDRVAKTST